MPIACQPPLQFAYGDVQEGALTLALPDKPLENDMARRRAARASVQTLDTIPGTSSPAPYRISLKARFSINGLNFSGSRVVWEHFQAGDRVQIPLGTPLHPAGNALRGLFFYRPHSGYRKPPMPRHLGVFCCS